MEPTTMMIIAALFIIIVPLFVMLFMAYQKISRLENSGSGEMMMNVINSLRQEISAGSAQNRVEMQQRLDIIARDISSSSQKNFDVIQNQFRQSAGIIKDVTEKLVELDKTNRQVLDFSRQMQSLENILKNPKQRGILGEYFLETLLGNVLQPNQYTMQYQFPNGDRVDAVIFYKDSIIPVDAKFSLEKYNKIMGCIDEKEREQLEKEFRRDVKDRIDETSKYIRPGDNTTEFAFMFIPAEGVYYNLLIYNSGSVQINVQDLIEYAFKKHVIIVSPTSFYAYLETVLQGLKAQKVEENVKDIIKKINELGRHLVKYEEFSVKVGKNLSATVSSYNDAAREFRKVDKDIYKITGGETGGKFDPLLVDRPSSDE